MALKKTCCLFILLTFIVVKSPAQVNLQTGSANFSLPIFDWKDHKSRLHTAVTINYASGNGLKVDDIASNIGQGWNLMAGGVITRLQVGEPDDQYGFDGTGNEWDIRKYPTGYLFANTPAENGCPDALTKYPIYSYKDQVYKQYNSVTEDKQPDYFSFQFNGKSGMFVLKTGGTHIGLPVGDTKMKITFDVDMGLSDNTLNGTRTVITSFTIQDVDGLIYRFTQHGKTKVLESNYCDAALNIKQKSPKFKNNKVYFQSGYENNTFINPWIIGSWYLTEIEDPLTNRKILFTYNYLNLNNIAGQDITYNWEDKYALIAYKKSVTKTLELNTITFPDDRTAQCIYGSPRLDYIGQNALSEIHITDNSVTVARHLFQTSYFIQNRYGTPVTDYQKKIARLCLLSVRKIGPDSKEDTPPYKFDYYMGSNATDDYVPPPFSYAKDVWGYYNGNNTQGFNYEALDIKTSASLASANQLKGVCFLRNNVSGTYLNPKAGYAKNGLLRQIIYPTGGTLTYEYVQNTGVLNGSTVNIGGVHVSQTSATDGGYSNGCNNPVITQYNYVLENSTESSLWGIEMPNNVNTSYNHYKPEKKKYKPPFGCKYVYQYPGIVSQYQAISLSDFQKVMIALSPYLGVASVVGTVIDVINLVFFSSGVMAVVAVVLDIISALFEFFLTCLNNPEKNITRNIFVNYDLNGVSPLPMQYKRVEVIQSPGGIGKTIHEFTSLDDYALWEPANPAMSAKQRFAPWAYGLPKKITLRDNNGYKVKETENVYNFNTSYSDHCYSQPHPHYDRYLLIKQEINQPACKCLVKRMKSQRNTRWTDPGYYNDPNSYLLTSNGDMLVDMYKVYTGRTELNMTYERTYKPNSSTDYLETVSQFVYNDENYEISMIKTWKSENPNHYLQKNFYYTIDYVRVHQNCYLLDGEPTSNPEINALVQNNIIGLLVETNSRSNTDDFGSYPKYTSDQATIFTTLSNGDIKPAYTIEGRFSQPQERNSHWERDYSNVSYNFPQPLYNPDNPDFLFYTTTETFTYDATGALTGVKDEAGRSVTNIYDYDNRHIVASVINASPTLDKPAYTSFETGNLGDWTLTGSSFLVFNSGITGSTAFDLTSNTLSRSGLNTSKPYTLSFWATSTVFVLGSATQVKSGPTISGYTYHEYDIAQGTSSVSVSGSSRIDELRLYPKSARMRSATYDPIMGKTSDCDENNRVNYYEYDNLARLRFIRDDRKNILKMYEYNYVSEAKLNGCPGTYGNRMISEVFTKNNCSPGYAGTNVEYTVAANTYTSAISQLDADTKAENAILANGQDYANTNGSCLQIYYNTVQSLTVATENCPAGYVGGNITYTVPANTYSSLISQADANQQALDDIAANADAYANDPANAVCVISYDPDWEWDNETSHCANVNGQLPAHLFVFETDVNPNSPTYLQTRWTDLGPDDACPAGNYYNTDQGDFFTRNNCPVGYTGTSVYYSVPAGTYSSTVSVAAANTLAINDVNANGQAYANTNGICSQACGTCSGEGLKCINGECEIGFQVYTDSYYDPLNNRTVCVYHYEWSDSSWSGDYYEYHPGSGWFCLIN